MTPTPLLAGQDEFRECIDKATALRATAKMPSRPILQESVYAYWQEATERELSSRAST